MESGIMGLPAPPLKQVRWIDAYGKECRPLSLGELGRHFKVLYFFQHWCSACHRHGFPTFVKLAHAFHGKGVGLAAIQTVFEGEHVNTFERLRYNQRRYGLWVPFGHAVAESASLGAMPAIIEEYRSGGTPWFVVVAPDGQVVYDGFLVVADGLIRALNAEPNIIRPLQ